MRLFGFRYSVYVRAARLALEERGIAYDLVEVNPFTPEGAAENPHPMNRIPLLDHDGFRIHETAAILSYLAGFPGPPLIPEDGRARARMVQVQGIVDSYAYWPMVRQVYSAAVFDGPRGVPTAQAEVEAGLKAAAPVLTMLEEIAAEGLVLDAGRPTLADLHLAPMVAAFVQAKEGAAALARRPALAEWWRRMAARDSLSRTDPGPPPAG
ncbi:MAG: glutathione S-transferase family protein [Pseudooceanicola sp.]